MNKQDSINLIDKVVSDSNLWLAYEKTFKNKGSSGVDGITVYQLKSHMTEFYIPLRENKGKVEKRNIPTTTSEKGSHSQK